jgi:hypothetical protein
VSAQGPVQEKFTRAQAFADETRQPLAAPVMAVIEAQHTTFRLGHLPYAAPPNLTGAEIDGIWNEI